MPSNEEMAEFEKLVGDIQDPGIFEFQPGVSHSGEKVFDLCDQLVQVVMPDLVRGLNDGRPGVCQYLLARDGVAITVALVTPRSLLVAIEMPADMPPFVESDEG